ncbi:alpha-1,4-glucan--maltose-1-phosphate maltosyltransferase [Arsenicitalea aurantiaca]|uniref:Alpha-1,4-glucan:maltose-1-phosphate maltosyltransferase n=1 Tax=Arsenicitalea aurantiaca TaxID=1783274 RepID=A0A433XL98_9HYPH|nr:alpha-1,4-glucan--maltose-1-phosphate maltosyltransferase [Arsenicitalea aurantiaca]RUT34843.1 alpha-1,4-glucan--maltose-1-phosphate maltosyltransferase [Arsenicitalea aurantiaca]
MAERTNQPITRAKTARPRRSKTEQAPVSAPLDRVAELEALSALAARRIAIEGIDPEIDGGRFPAKAVVGQPATIEADIFPDGHEVIDAALLTRPKGTESWTETPFAILVNDRWRAEFTFPENRMYEFTIIAWRDLYATWRKEVMKKHAAGLDITLELEEGRQIIESAATQSAHASETDRAALDALLTAFEGVTENEDCLSLLTDRTIIEVMKRAGLRTDLTVYERILEIFVDRRAAAFSAWYELMPRSQSGDTEVHGTFDDVIKRLPYVRDLGFDVLYFPPIHPIGRTNRKGRNNTLTPGPDDPGSPYAIGSEDGGHDAIHPELGSFEDFARLVAAARAHGLEIALDFAIQCSPDHPWIKEHPDWFDWRPDGTIKFAENPPKKYEDIVNVHFYRKAIPDLWYALRDIVLFWIERGVTIFRVDNPHTKPFPFWEWMIADVRARHPEAIFLAEAFTRPKVMKRLAKVGFSQSYSYFTWRNLKWELEQYLTELTTEDCRHYMRPNFFANTPDINPVYLQHSGRPGFQARLILAATLAGNYGIYNGFEISEAAAVPGKEEYLNSEKYEIRVWDFDQPDNIGWDIRLINRLRREHEALQHFTNLKFYTAWNENVIYYGKASTEGTELFLFHVCLDPHNAQDTHFEVPLWEFGLPDDGTVDVEDMVSGNRFTWTGKVHQLRLDPHHKPYAIWRLTAPGAHR